MSDHANKFTKEYIQAVLLRDDAVGMHAVGRALVLLNRRQTFAEQRSKEVLRHNGVGFTPTDAELGTDMANFYTRNNYLTPKQLQYWRKPNVQGIPRIAKYWKQLLDDAKKRHGIVKVPRARNKNNNAEFQLDV